MVKPYHPDAVTPQFLYRNLNPYKYQLAVTYVHKTRIKPDDALPIRTEYVDLELDGTLTIRKGFAWDGASGPTYDSPSSIRASGMHDAFYFLMREDYLSKKNKKAVDFLFMVTCIDAGMWKPRAKVWHFGVLVGGSWHLDKDPYPKPEILEAP